MKRLAFLSAGLLAGLGLALAAVLLGPRWFGAPFELRGMALDGSKPAPNFAFTEAAGRRVQLSDFRDKVVAVYFGYTFCPDVCPTTLVDLKRAVEALGAQAEAVQVIFISVDPERDTPQRAMDYARAFNPDFIGLSGTLDEVASAATLFGVYFEKKASASAAGYLVDHTSVVTVVDRAGRIRVLWPFGFKSEDMTADLQTLLR